MEKGLLIATKIVIFSIIMCITFCCNDNYKSNIYLVEAENLLETYPDSAKALLAKIEEPYKLSDRDFAHWSMLSCRIKDLKNEELLLPADLEIAQRWYKKSGSTEDKARIGLFLARSLVADKEYERAMDEYLPALDIASKGAHYNLAGYISSYMADLYMDNNDFETAIIKYEEAAGYFKKSENQRSYAIAHRNIARMWAFLDSFSLALDYLHKADSLQEKLNDSAVKSSIFNHYGNIFFMKDDFEKAEEYYNLSMQCDTMDILSNSNALIALYIQKKELSKARQLLDSIAVLQLSGDFKSSLQYNYYLIAKEESNPTEALEHLEQFLNDSELHLLDKKELNFVEMEKKYNQLRIYNEYQKLRIHRLYFIIGVIILLIFILISYILFQTRQLRLKKELIKQKQDMLNLNLRYNQLQNTKLRSSDVGKELKKLAVKYIPQNEKPLITDSMWMDIEKEIKSTYPGFTEKIMTFCPELTYSELQYCYLLLFHFTGNEEAALLNINPDSVRKRRLRIRKKFGFQSENMGLYDFFTGFI